MECQTPDCDGPISLDDVRYPTHRDPARTQNDHPFPVARCPTCKKLNQVTSVGKDIFTQKIVEE